MVPIADQKKLRALLYEPIHPDATELLSTVAELRYTDDWEEDTIVEAVRDVDGIIIRAHGAVNARVMDAAPRLTVVSRHGVGFDNVDIAAATERGIYAANTPGVNADSVAEHAVGMMITLSKHLLSADRAMRRGGWEARSEFIGRELSGKTLGVVGFGHIGQRLAGICRNGFGMEILYYDVQAYPKLERDLAARKLELRELLRQADYVSVHVPLMPQTRGLIGPAEFAVLKSSAYFLNLSRGPVVDEEALIECLRQGNIRGAGIDVFVEEPTPADNPLLSLDNVVVTPHLAGMSAEAMWRMAMTAARNLLSVWDGNPPLGWVNRSSDFQPRKVSGMK